jgi:NADPH-dependent 2,4-dienoyl-CoA reductase/sulfur reductase-like enzyme
VNQRFSQEMANGWNELLNFLDRINRIKQDKAINLVNPVHPVNPVWNFLKKLNLEAIAMHLIIIGGVAAGSKAAARARRVNRDMTITLYQDESEVSYTACGQPYYLSGLIASREALIIRHADDFAAEGIDVRLNHRVTRLNTADRTLTVHDRKQDKVSIVPYDRLIIATGARSLMPQIPGSNLDGVLTLRSISELDRFRSALDRIQPKTAVIAGSGYIALEMAESLSALGVSVTLLGRNKQIFSRLDAEMSRPIHDYLAGQNVQIITGEVIAELNGNAGRIAEVVTVSGLKLPADLVVLALGVRPNVELAEQAGIQLGTTGAIAVDDRMETNVSGVFAAGDCAESLHRLTDLPVWGPLGDIANLQGRVAGENAAGGDARFPGVFGTAIFKTFDLKVGLTGLTEAAARAAGFDPVAAVISARDKARYYPGAREIKLKLVAEAATGRLLGAQAVGIGNVDKIIDIAATALLGNLGCRDLEFADLAYAPPFSPVLSPMIVAAGELSKKIRQRNVLE